MSGVMPTPVVDGDDSDDRPVPPTRGSASSRDGTTPGFGPQGVAAKKPLPPDAAGPPTRLCVTLKEHAAHLKRLDPKWRAVLRHHAHSVHFLSPRCYEIVDGAEMDASAEMLRA